MNVRSVFLFFAVPLVSACATPSKAPEQAELPVEATVVWGNQGYGGAAERIPGYVHALHRGGVVYRDAPASPEPQPPKAAFFAPAENSHLLTPQTLAAIVAVSARNMKSVSLKAAVVTSVDDKQHRAWEKYCNGGHGMADEEWQIVREVGAPENVPADLADHCIHPK